MAQDSEALREVRKAAGRLASSRLALESAVRGAHANGAPLRVIAEAAAVSHEQVRRLIRGA